MSPTNALGAPAQVYKHKRAAFDVWITPPKGVRVNSGSCRYIYFTVRQNYGYLDRFTASVDVWRGSSYLDQTFDYVYDSRGSLRADYFYCPYEGVGTFRLGPTEVEWNNYSTEEEGSFSDASRATFVIKQDQQCRLLHVGRPPGKLSISAKLRWFSIDAQAWRATPTGTRVLLQRENNGGWKTIGAARVRDRGQVTISARRGTARSNYRVIQVGTPHTWSCIEPFSA